MRHVGLNEQLLHLTALVYLQTFGIVNLLLRGEVLITEVFARSDSSESNECAVFDYDGAVTCDAPPT